MFNIASYNASRKPISQTMPTYYYLALLEAKVLDVRVIMDVQDSDSLFF